MAGLEDAKDMAVESTPAVDRDRHQLEGQAAGTGLADAAGAQIGARRLGLAFGFQGNVEQTVDLGSRGLDGRAAVDEA